jgi:type IV pilus assembly protein PilM
VVVLAYDYIEHAKILTQADAEPPELIAKSLEKFLSRNDLTEDRVVVSVPGQHTLARFSKLPPVDAKKIPDIVQFEANQQIPFDMEEVIWDYQAFTEEDSPEIEVGIFAMKRDLIHQHLAHFSDVGIEPVIVQSAPLADFDAMAFDGRLSSETTVLLDIGAENTDLIITDGVRLWTRTIPIGGNNFTDALAAGFKLSFSKAENLKRQAATSKYARQIFQAMRPVFADLVGEIQRSIGFYSSTHRGAKLEVMLALGNAFKLPGLQKFLQQNLGIKVSKPSAFKNLGGSEKFHADHGDNLLGFAVAYGLAVEGLDRGRMKNNLLPPEIARQAVWRRKRPWFAAAAACLLMSALAVHWRYSADIRLAQAEGTAAVKSMNFEEARRMLESGVPSGDSPRTYAQKVLAVAKTIKAEYDKQKGEGAGQRQQCEEILTLLEGRHIWAQVIPLVHAALPAPPELLASAKDSQAYIDALLANPHLARPQRSEIFIDELSSQLLDNVYADDYRSRSEQKELFDYYTAKDAPLGFLVTLRCTTPHADKGKFVESEFVRRLQENGRQSGLGFYFDGVRLIGGLGETVSAPRPGARGSRGASAPAAASAVAKPKAAVDLLTLEDASEDWRFEVKFVVALADLPDQQTPGTPGAAGATGGRGG